MAKRRANGEGTLRKRSDGRWESAITIGYNDDGTPKRKYFYGKKQSEVKEKVEAWNKKKGSKKIVAKEYTFTEWSDFWFENHKDDITPTTQENYKYTLKILQNYFGKDPIDEILALDVETFLKSMRADGRSTSYISTCRGLLHQIFRKAEANGLIEKNPVALADKLRSREPKKKKEAFTTEEVRLLMAKLPHDRLGISIRLMLGTGMRAQELLALEPKHIEEDGSVIHIEQAINMIKGTAVVGCPKSRDSYRDIPVPPSFRGYAMELRNTDLSYIWEAGKKGQPCNPSHFRNKFKEAIGKIEGVRVLTPHSCRHTYVSQMQAIGIDLETIKYIVGHADIDMTEHYLHVQKSKINQAIELFGSEFGVSEV